MHSLRIEINCGIMIVIVVPLVTKDHGTSIKVKELIN